MSASASARDPLGTELARPARVSAGEDVALIDLLDRLLGGGVVLAGDITLAVADVDLVYVGLRALISSVATAEREGVRLPVIYVYGITEAGARVPELEGLDNQPVHALKATEVAGLYSEHDRGESEFEPEPSALWQHDRVVEAAMSSGPVLPARFGTTFADPDALEASLEPVGLRLARQLERVRGCVELAVRVLPPEEAISVAQTGSEYIRFKLARNQERRALVEQTLVPLAAHAIQSRSSTLDSDQAALTASYLVRADEVDRFADEVRLLARRHSKLSFSCTGPWPPYSFVCEEAEEHE